MSFSVRSMSFIAFCALWIFFLRGISGQFDANFTLENSWGRLPSKSGLRSTIQCISSDGDPNKIKFSRKVDTGQGTKLPRRSQQTASGKIRIFLMTADDKLNRFGAFQCKINRGGVQTEISTLKLPPEGLVELDAKSPYIVANRGDDVELEVTVQKTLPLTLKWRHNGQDDIAAWDDKLKVQLTNVQESDAGIYECYYDSRRSESVHAILQLIVRGCPADFYGENCESECPSCYNGGICHDKYGVCVCPAGFTGENCEQACGGNHYGADCSIPCTPPKEGSNMDEGCALHLFCKPDPYGCSCAPGFKGSTCMDHCAPGWYGADCKQECHCFFGKSSCNRITGACEGGCARGWRGNACQIEDADATPGLMETTTMAYCPLGHYGPSCEKDCHCAGSEVCHVSSGECPSGCEDGWGGTSCSVCRTGRFGYNCESTCHCEGGDHKCDEDGFCMSGCKAGWAGFTCQQGCTPGRFGSNCASVCHCKDGPSACDRVTGICTGECNPGFMGEDCQTMCPPNKYGVNCMQFCTCLNGGQCSRTDGKCTCEGRWRGTICNESEPEIIAATDEEINVGQMAFISCTVDAIPEPRLNITSDKFPGLFVIFRKLEQNQYQAIVKATPLESGDMDFYCSAENHHGHDMKIITLSVFDPPRLLKEPELQSTSSTSMVVIWKEWEHGKDGGGKYGDSVEYMTVYRKVGSTHWINVETWKPDRLASFENLEPNTEYEVAVKCRRPGKGGIGEPSPSLKAKTDCGEPLPDAIPRNFVEESINISSVKLTWEPPSEIHLKCTLTGYRLEYHMESNPSHREVLDMTEATNEVELNNLTEHSEYVLRLFPSTTSGNSRYFAELIIRTEESTPDPVRNLTSNPTEKPDELLVTWEEPDITRGTILGYVVSYQITNRGMCNNTSDDDHAEKKLYNTTLTQMTLKNLHPYSAYLVSVRAKTSAGEGDATSTIGRTAESIPDGSPPNARMTSKGSTYLEFKWDPIPCELANGIIVDYEYRVVTSEMNELGHNTLNKRSAGSDFKDNVRKVKGLEVIVGNLAPYKEYGFAVRGNTNAGPGVFTNFLFAMTDEAAPSAPRSFNVSSTSNSSLTLSWIAPDPPVGNITNYRLMYYVANEPLKTVSYLTLNATSLQTDSDGKITGKVLGLEPATEYILQVQASTNAGWGNWSDQLTAKTLDAAPSAPRSFNVSSTSNSSLTLSWIAPDPPVGNITNYRLMYYVAKEPLKTTSLTLNATSLQTDSDGKITGKVLGLEPATEYILQVQASTNAGWGNWSDQLTAKTLDAGESVVPDVEIVHDEATQETIPIKFSTLKKSSVNKYQIIVEDARNIHGIDENLLSDYDTAVVKGGLPYYITAELDPKNLSDSGQEKFVVGDKKVWGGYKNVHLNAGHKYRIRIRILTGTNQGSSKSILSDGNQNVSVTPVSNNNSVEEYEIFGMNLILFIFILACTLVLLVVIIFLSAIYFCRKKERRKVSKSERNSGLSESMTWSVMYKVSENEAVDGPLVSEGYKVMHDNENVMSLKKIKKDSKNSIGIKVENLPEYVHTGTAGTRFSDEFMRLAAGQTAPWTVARKSENLKKNRYGNVLPYDRHRVVLHFDQNASGSDYINASYIDGYRRPKEYIVTQGPLESTVIDFWRMVWQESVPVIVMVTELIENDKPKCVQYWPDDSMVCGKLQILLIHSEQNTNFVIRTILMRSMEEGSTHRVHQYQFTEWPDKTIPSNPCFLIKMMKRMRNDNPVLGGPMVVHCSAGAGRSGTFVALDALTQQAEEEKRVDIYRFVNCSRLQRINLVQTEEQYVFIHEALLEAIQYEDTAIPLERVPMFLKEMSEKHSQDYSPTIQRQYDMLNTTQKRVDINMCSDALSECNIFKNRDPMTVPADSVRIRLESDSSEDDYINAISVNGYRRKDAFIVTQMPLQHTTEDFWQLVYTQKSSLLLMLNGCDQDDCLNIGQYWPSRGQEMYGKFEVHVVTFEDQGEVIIRIMRLIHHDQPHNEPHKVIQLQYKGWKNDLPPGPDSMLNLVNMVDLWYSRSSGGPITVHCLDGTARSGLFCAVSYICGQIKAEGLVDVYQMAKDIRINRPEFLPTLEQYKFCFQVAQELAESIAESNNTNTIGRKRLSCYV